MLNFFFFQFIYSDMLDFFRDFMQAVKSLRMERDHRAVMTMQKAPLQPNISWPAASQYLNLLTPYAMNYVTQQERLTGQVHFGVVDDNKVGIFVFPFTITVFQPQPMVHSVI